MIAIQELDFSDFVLPEVPKKKISKDIRGKEYSTILDDTEITPRHIYQENKNGELYIVLSKEDALFWGDNAPLEIIFATGSTRKAIQVSRQLSGLKFPSLEDYSDAETDPLSLQVYFDKRVYNGNKNLQGKVLLGYFHGVPVFAETQDGETSANENPDKEAKNKVRWLWEVGGYKGQNVMIVSSDTVDRPSTITTFLGKPMYYPSFPQLDAAGVSIELYEKALTEFSRIAEKALKHAKKCGMEENLVLEDIDLAKPKPPGSDIQEVQLASAQGAYLRLFKLAYYPVGTILRHFNAVAVLDGNNGTLLNQESKKEKGVRLRLKVTEEGFNRANAKKDTGGGGLFQQLMNWELDTPDLLKTVQPELKNFHAALREELEDKDENLAKWAIYCTIIGMPLVSIKQIIELSKDRRKKKVTHE